MEELWYHDREITEIRETHQELGMQHWKCWAVVGAP